jgi:transcriptional regulator CtsR
VEKGYIVESKRGGGGYIRIIKVVHQDKSELIDEIIAMIQPTVTQQVALDVLNRLVEEELITEREMKIMASVMDRNVLAFQLPLRDEIRTRLLTTMLSTLKYLN